MEHICMIVDLDGYRIRSGFIARELGVYSLKDGSLSWMFDNPLPFFYLDKKDQRTCHYVYRHVHGLPWQTRSQEKAHPQHMVKPIVDTLYRSCRTPERWLVAYKGGCGKESTQRATDSLCEFRRLWLSESRETHGDG